MRRTHLLFLLLVALLGTHLLLSEGTGLAQQGGKKKMRIGGDATPPDGGTPVVPGTGKKGGPEGGKKGKGPQWDPGQLFDFVLDREKRGYFLVSEAKRDREVLEAFAKKEGIADGKITKDQYLKYSEVREKIREEIGAPPPKGPGGGKGPPDPEKLFKDYDLNSDGFLSPEEIEQMRGPFPGEWEKWDKNKDKKIDLEEYKAYWAHRQAEREQKTAEKAEEKKREDAKKEGITRIEIDEVEDFRPVVFHNNSMPKELPPWFRQMDTNKDGMVSLAEWVKAGKTPEEFLVYDRNDDGLITIEEVMRKEGLLVAKADNDNPGVVVDGAPRSNFMGKGGKGGKGAMGNFPIPNMPGNFDPSQFQGMFGKGGFGKGNFGKKGGGSGEDSPRQKGGTG